MKMKKITTSFQLTEKQYERLKKESEEIGNSQSSIVRTALERYWNNNRMVVEHNRNHELR